MTDQFLPTQSKLARKLASQVGLFFVVATILLLTWMFWRQRRESLTAFRNLAANNAAFISDLRYPRSPQLASQLSNILGMGVGFAEGNGPIENIRPSMHTAIMKMTQTLRPSARQIEGFDVAVAPLSGSGKFLILVRAHPARETVFSFSLLLPILILGSGCVALVMALSRNIVRPLRDLTEWLPNLQRDETNASERDTATLEPILLRNDEIGSLAVALTETRDSLRREKRLRQRSEKLAALGRVATSLAHEVKNPAAAIQMHADLLTEHVEGENRLSVELIKEEVDHITGLVDQWMFLAKTPSATTLPHDLNEVTDRVLNRMEAQADHAGIALSKQLCPSPLPVQADDRRIGQIIRNLLVNAIQAMPEGGTIAVETDLEKGTRAVLRISDQGPGFSTKALERFSEPFFSEKEGGMGIGLTLSREVAEAHGGELFAENLPGGQGARLTLALPLKSNSQPN